MATSFFGGDPSRAHWSVSVHKKLSDFRNTDERKAERERVRAAQAKVTAAGFQQQSYFAFTVGDEAKKASQRKRADEYAAKVETATGVRMAIHEGCFL